MSDTIKFECGGTLFTIDASSADGGRNYTHIVDVHVGPYIVMSLKRDRESGRWYGQLWGGCDDPIATVRPNDEMRVVNSDEEALYSLAPSAQDDAPEEKVG